MMRLGVCVCVCMCEAHTHTTYMLLHASPPRTPLDFTGTLACPTIRTAMPTIHMMLAVPTFAAHANTTGLAEIFSVEACESYFFHPQVLSP